MERNTKVIAYWHPDLDLTDESHANHDRLAAQFEAVATETLGYPVRFYSVQSPAEMAEWVSREEDPFAWHQDCGGKASRFLVWSNVQPTEVRFPNGEMLNANAGAIILIDNMECEHRTPPPLHPKRWLVHSRGLNTGVTMPTPKETQKKIKLIVVDELGCDENEITPNADIMHDLGADSLDSIELSMRIEEEFGIPDIPDEDLDKMLTFGDLCSYVEKKLAEKC